MKGFDEKILYCKLSNRDMVKMTQTKNQMTMIPILMNWIFFYFDDDDDFDISSYGALPSAGDSNMLSSNLYDI